MSEYYLDGNTILEVQFHNEQYRFIPDDETVRPDAEEYQLDTYDKGEWMTVGNVTQLEHLVDDMPKLQKLYRGDNKVLVREEE